MKNETTVKIDALSLSGAGWTEAQIDRYYALLARKQARGLTSLSPEGRAFLRSARVAVDAFEQTRKAELVAAAKRRVSGKQPVETKLHYLWVQREAELAHKLVEVAPGEISAFAIYAEEVVRALGKYQPVLDQIDTSKRFKFNGERDELLAFAASFGRVANFDRVAFLDELNANFADNWQPCFTEAFLASSAYFGAVIADSDELDFRAEVRVLVECLTREVYPSVTATV